MVVYFSGTGNSRFAAKAIAQQLQDELLDAGALIKAGERGVFMSERPFVFVSPIYAWQLPHIFADFIRSAELSGSRDAYFVLTCGSDIGNAGKYAAALCAEKGLNYRGMLEVVMPENYIAMFRAPKREEAERIVKAAKPVLRRGAEYIARGEDFPASKSGALNSLKSSAVNKLFYKRFIKADAFLTTDACIGCGKCAELCPLNNIHLENARPVWGQDCTHCMACICHCPTEAIEYGKKSRGKVRYRCPETVE